MSEERLAALEGNFRAVTDQVGRLMDIVLQKGFEPAFRCAHSGLLLPGNFVKDWGREFGVGYGPSPVSEILDTDYSVPPPAITPDIRRIEQIMHPVRVCGAQVDLVMVSPEEFEAKAAILDSRDPGMERRASIVRAKQMQNPQSRLPNVYAAWERARKGAF